MTSRPIDPNRWPQARSWRLLQAGLTLGLLATAVGGMPARAAGPASAAADDPGTKTLAQIEGLIGPAHCTSDLECRVAGIGARPCGGPESYLAWSTQTTPAEKLDPCLKDYAEQRRRWHAQSGRLSTCEFRAAPVARCLSQGSQPARCVLVPQAQGVR